MTQGRSSTDDLDAMMPSLREKMVGRLPERARLFREAADRLERDVAGAREELREVAHKLAGIAASYGFDALGASARELELATLGPADATVLARDARALADACDHVRELVHASSAASAPAETETRGASNVSERVPAAARGRILVIDDDEATGRLVRLALSRLGGFEVDLADSAEAGFARLASNAYDVIVSDAMMPDTDGLGFVSRVRTELPSLATVPIVILSAASPDEVGVEDSPHRPDAWLRKPIRPQELVRALRAYIEAKP